ncbi:helix-turn-helix domain-containing protein [Olsenella uli]|uniref:helix-turn-helix domain-containing protein n=1 Tax=Olsenella uli TaxID=133926 RepID=UPI003C6E725A
MMSWNQKLFSRRLKLLRIDSGLSQEHLGALAGISQSALNKWESGSAIPSLDKAYDVAESLGCPLSLLCGEGSLDEFLSATAPARKRRVGGDSHVNSTSED